MKSTKELAKELGLLKKKQKVVKDHDKTEGTTQRFSYLIVLDFESTCWQNDKFRSQEIMLLNLRTGEVEAEFHSYVQPQENPILSRFCTQLTGISQNQVDDGIPLFICLKKFSAWLTQQSTMRKFSFPPSITDSNACFLTWSDWDLSVCLHYECRRKQLRRPPEMDYWIDLRATYKKFYNRRPNGLKGALQEVGIIFEGREHSGLHDSRNTAMLAKKMILDGCRLQVTKSIHSNVNLTSLNGDMWKYRASHTSSVKSTLQKTSKVSQENIHYKQQCSSDDIIHNELGNSDEMWLCENIDDSDTSLSEEPCMDGESQPTSECKGSNLWNEFQQSRSKVIKSGTSLSDLMIPCHNSAGTDNVSPVPLINKYYTVQERSNFTSRINNKEIDKENMSYAINRIPKRSNDDNPRTPLLAINRNMPLYSHLQTDKGQFTSTNSSTAGHSFEKNLPETLLGLNSKNPKQNHSKCEQIFISTSFTTPIVTRSSKSLVPINTSCTSKLLDFNSPFNASSFPADLNCRTPPLCGCGCRTKRKHVRNGGPNHGRTFFTCQKVGCKFFQWEFKEKRNANVSAIQILPTFSITSSYINNK